MSPQILAWHAGTVHVPADQLPAALKMAPRDWELAYRSPKPSLDDWLVMQCRDNKRATWAAQIAQDQGWPRVLVHREVRCLLILKRIDAAREARRNLAPARDPAEPAAHISKSSRHTTVFTIMHIAECSLQGVYGWRVHPTVRSYASYKKGEPPPEPEPFQSEPLDAGRSKLELAQLGMRSL